MIKIAPLLLILFVAACGLTPVYGTKENKQSVHDVLNKIEIGLIPDREGQYLRNALIDRFYSNGYPENIQFFLSVQPIKETISNFDLTFDSSATRRQLKLTSHMVLIDKKTGTSVLKRPLTAITSHNVLDSEFSTLITEQSAREAALNDMARQIEQQIALFLNR